MKKFQNTLYINDNLYILLGLNSESVDLIYLDPPFNSKRTYSAPVGSKAAGVSFKDMWTWKDVDEYNLDSLAVNNLELTKFIASVGSIHSKAMMAYLTYMAQRIIEMHRVLKRTGALYLHCDPTASHYLKTMMDGIFGQQNSQNEIIWKRTSAHNRARRWGPIHDVLLFYSKGNDYTWNRTTQKFDDAYAKTFYNHEDDKGRYRTGDLTGPGTRAGDSGREWKGINPTAKGRHWEPPPDRVLPNWFKYPDRYSAMPVRKRLDVLDQQGLIYWPTTKAGVPRFKGYLTNESGITVQDIITDISPVQAHSKERLGYPTQKPIELLQRIISASSNAGDIVLDPFCGCATTCVAAEQLGRKWIGVDIEEKATDILIKRLNLATGILNHFVATDKLPSRSDLKEIKPTESVKQRLHKEQKGLCNACGKEFEIRNLEIDHIIPKSKGGGDYYENYQLLCGSCNRIKGDRPMEYLRAKIATIEKTKAKVFFGE